MPDFTPKPFKSAAAAVSLAEAKHTYTELGYWQLSQFHWQCPWPRSKGLVPEITHCVNCSIHILCYVCFTQKELEKLAWLQLCSKQWKKECWSWWHIRRAFSLRKNYEFLPFRHAVLQIALNLVLCFADIKEVKVPHTDCPYLLESDVHSYFKRLTI